MEYLVLKKGIEIENENGVKQYIGEGVFSRIFTVFQTPSSIKVVNCYNGKRGIGVI